MSAELEPTLFKDCYDRFQTTYTNEGPVIVMYYQLNDVIKVYMEFHNIIWCTEVPYSEGMKYVSMFPGAIKLEKDYDD